MKKDNLIQVLNKVLEDTPLTIEEKEAIKNFIKKAERGRSTKEDLFQLVAKLLRLGEFLLQFLDNT